MRGNEEHIQVRELIGPYVLGALPPEEAREVAEHLRSCPECREEEQRLRRVHESLAELAAISVEPPPELKGRVMSRLPRRRARLAPILALAAALVMLAVLGIFSGAFLGREEVATASLKPTEMASGAGGQVRIYDEGANVRVRLEVWGMPELKRGEYYELWFVEDGDRMSGGTFEVGKDGSVQAEMNAPAMAREYHQVGITAESGGDPAPSDRKMLGGELQKL